MNRLRGKSSEYLSLLFFISLVIITCGGLYVSHCFYCEKYFHRYDNGSCPQEVSGCTTCINGSVIDPENLNTCLELNLTEKPAKQTRVPLRGTVIIPCVCSVKVACMWKKDGHRVEFVLSHRYLLKIEHEAYTTDCSLVIKNASLEDEDLWTCTNIPIAHENNSNFTFAGLTQLYVDQPTVIVVEQSALSVWEIVLIVIGVGLTLSVIAFTVYKCYKRQSLQHSLRKMSNEMINNTRFTRMPSSPTREEPFKLIPNWKKCADKKLSII